MSSHPEKRPSILRRVYRAPFLSPTWLVSRAVLIAWAYLVGQLLGWREHTTILSGTMPTESGDPFANGVRVAAGLVYACLYFAVTIVTPIFLIAAGLLGVGRRLRASRPEARSGDHFESSAGTRSTSEA